MKIVFSNLPMKKELYGFKYAVDGNASIEYNGEVIFPVNSVLAKILKRGEKVKVILLSKTDIAGNSAINAGLFQKELNEMVLLLCDKVRCFSVFSDSGNTEPEGGSTETQFALNADYNNIPNEYTFQSESFLQSCTNQTRLSWNVVREYGWGNAFQMQTWFIYLDNIRVSIIQ